MEPWTVDPAPLAAIADAMDDDGALAKALGEKFAASLPDTISALESAAEERDVKTLIVTAHDLKSTARLVGAQHLGDVAETIESAARAGEILVDGSTREAVEPTVVGLRSVLQAIEKGVQNQQNDPESGGQKPPGRFASEQSIDVPEGK